MKNNFFVVTKGTYDKKSKLNSNSKNYEKERHDINKKNVTNTKHILLQ